MHVAIGRGGLVLGSRHEAPSEMQHPYVASEVPVLTRVIQARILGLPNGMIEAIPYLRSLSSRMLHAARRAMRGTVQGHTRIIKDVATTEALN